MSTHHMTKDDSSRIQSSQARSGGDMSSSGFAARAQSAGDRSASSYSTSGSGLNTNAGYAGGYANTNAGDHAKGADSSHTTR